MSKEISNFLNSNKEAKAFDSFRKGQKLPFFLLFWLGMLALFRDPFLWVLRTYPGAVGIKFRIFFYRLKLKMLGKNCIISEGVYIDGMQNISISDYVWVDRNVTLSARVGSIKIGKRVHIADRSIISGAGHVEIGDYVGISSNVMIYSHSEAPVNGKRMSGPMIPEEHKGMVTKKVQIHKDAFIGSQAVILPGVIIGEGAIVGACSLVRKNVEPYQIVSGVPARLVGKREKITVPDL